MISLVAAVFLYSPVVMCSSLEAAAGNWRDSPECSVVMPGAQIKRLGHFGDFNPIEYVEVTDAQGKRRLYIPWQ